MEQKRSSYVDIFDGRLRVHHFGSEGPAVILLHGGGTDSGLLSWKETIPALVESFRVIVPDWPGYGESDLLEGAHRLDRMGDMVGELMDVLDLPSADVVGVSMGGGAALDLALRRPERVNKLVLVDSYGLQKRVPVQFFSWLVVRIPYMIQGTWALLRKSRWMTRWTLAGIMHQKDAVTPELVEEVYQAVQHQSSAKAFYAFQRYEVLPGRLRSCYLDQLHGINIRTLLIHGENDSLVPLRWAREAAGLIYGAELVVMPQCGHWPQRESPALFNRTLKAFLLE
jgi:pimeloyl-ACP methyl ester carboxylesterase